jgi:hypothetical protein
VWLDLISKATLKLALGVGWMKRAPRSAVAAIPDEEKRKIQRNASARKARLLCWPLDAPKDSGGDIEEAIPDPISNSEVKLLGADGTARFLVWESRTLPG